MLQVSAMRYTSIAIVFASAAGKYVAEDGTVYCGGSTWNAPGASQLRAKMNAQDLGEECELLPLYPKDVFEGTEVERTTWFQDRTIFGERNSAKVAAWEAMNVICEELQTDSLNLPKRTGTLVWNHLGGKDGWNWGRCQDDDTQNLCRGGPSGCPPRVKSTWLVPGDRDQGRTSSGTCKEGNLDEFYCLDAFKEDSCMTNTNRQYIQIDDIGDLTGEPLSFRVTNLFWAGEGDGGYIKQTDSGAYQTQMQGAALQINVAPDSKAKFKYEFILTNTEQQPEKSIWPICFTFYVSRRLSYLPVRDRP